MRFFLSVFLMGLLSALGCLGAQTPVQMELVCLERAPVAGGVMRAALKFRMESGWHIYSDKAGDVGAPPVVAWELPQGWTAEPLQFPPAERFETFGLVSYGYEGTVYIPVAFVLAEGARVNAPQTVRVKADVLACAEECVPVLLAAELTFPQTVAAEDVEALQDAWAISAPAPVMTDASWAWLFFSAILGGLILNVMPCVFPVIGLKVMGFVQQAGGTAKHAWKQGLAFAFGVLVSLWILAAVLLLLRSGGTQLGWGFQLQSSGFTFLLTVLFFTFGLSLMGVFEIGERATGAGASLMRKEGFWGAFFSGVLAVVVATPCSAPFFAPVIGAALAMPAVGSLALFTGVGIGLALPYFVLCLFPALLNKMPKPGPWMETLRQFFGLLFFATASYLVWVLARLTDQSEWALLAVMGALVLIGAAAWIYGKWGAFSRASKTRRLATALALIFFAGACWLGWPTKGDAGFQWEPYSAQRLDALRAEGRPVWVDFTARWCVTCLTNKATLASSAELHRLVREKNVALLKADWTNRDEAITRELAKFGRASVPLNLLYLPGQQEPILLPTVLTPGDLTAPLSEAR